jgi:hypothetical protein
LLKLAAPGIIGGTFGAINSGVAAYRAADGHLSEKWGAFLKTIGVGFVTGAAAAYGGVVAAGAANSIQLAVTEYFMTGDVIAGDMGANFAKGLVCASIAKYLPLIPDKGITWDLKTVSEFFYDFPASIGENMIGVTVGEYLFGEISSTEKLKQNHPSTSGINIESSFTIENSNHVTLEFLITPNTHEENEPK